MHISNRYCSNQDDAKSQTNQAFLKILQNLKNYDPNKPFTPWIRTIAIRLAIDAHRQKQRDLIQLKDEDWHENNETEVPSEILQNMELEHIEAALRRIDENQRMVFNLFVVEGYAHKEIADLMEISERSSKRLLQKAKEELKRLLLETVDRQKVG